MVTRNLHLILIAVIMCVVAGACGEKSADEYRPLGMPKDVTFVEGRPVWREMVVGQATREEVTAALGRPEMTWSSGDLEVWRYLPAGYKRSMYDFDSYYRLFFRQGILQVISVQCWGVDYDALREELGDPERLIECKTQDNVAVFANRGMTAVVFSWYPVDSSVVQLQYYTPMSLEEYMGTWGRFHPEEMPWPIQVPERVDALGFVPGQTQRRDVEAALGQPDFEWTDAQSGTKVVYYHAPGRIPDNVHRFDFRDEVLTWMNVRVWQEDYTIESAIARLGKVGVVARARFYDLIPPIQYYLWPERGIVLVASMEQPSHPIETELAFPYADPNEVEPNGADVVIAYIRFEPIPLDLDKCAEIIDRVNEEVGLGGPN